ncbi:MAG: PDZ domain-containing protein [Planctomycetaceae bacterium]|nr:PDZ domain-containing protein [Planctomycetaceae bacterium]
MPQSPCNGREESRKLLVKRLKLGDFEHEQLEFSERRPNAVGLDYLSRFVVTLDFQKNVIYLERGERFGESQRTHKAGLRLARVAVETRIEEVFAGGPAKAAGLQAGDRIVQIGNRSADEFSLLELYRLFEEEDRHVPLVVERRGRRHELKLVLPEQREAKLEGSTTRK